MTGPQHYQAAEALLEESGKVADVYSAEQVLLIGRAQAHAALALAAATIDAAYGSMSIDADKAWTIAMEDR